MKKKCNRVRRYETAERGRKKGIERSRLKCWKAMGQNWSCCKLNYVGRTGGEKMGGKTQENFDKFNNTKRRFQAEKWRRWRESYPYNLSTKDREKKENYKKKESIKVKELIFGLKKMGLGGSGC